MAEQQLIIDKSEASRIKAEIAVTEARIAKYLHLLADPDIDSLGRKAICRQLSGMEAKQIDLRAARDAVGDKMAQNIADLAQPIREAFGEAKGAGV